MGQRIEESLGAKHFRRLVGILLVALISLTAAPATLADQLLRVGPSRAIKTIGDAAKLAGPRAVIEIDAGTYIGDVAVWGQDSLVIRGVGGPVRLMANGKSAEGKAIWVMRGNDMTVENIAFSDAKVPDRNGAGIRLEKGRLTVRNSRFLNNENGILTSNQSDIELSIENSEFGYNGSGDGQTHNIYVGSIARFTMVGSYVHHSIVGHLLKSRARESVIRNNRLTDEVGGRASYELDFPNGGKVVLIGNLVQQSRTTENTHMLAFGAEGYRWPENSLSMAHNTLVDERPSGGIFMRVAPGVIKSQFMNNLFAGQGKLEYPSNAKRFGDMRVALKELANAEQADYRLRREPPDLFAITVSPEDKALVPSHEYVHPLRTAPLKSTPRLPGALQQLAGQTP